VTLVAAVRVMWIIEEHHTTTWERNKVTAIRLFENCAVEHEVRLAVHNDAARERYDIVEALRSACEVVGGGDYGSTACRLCLEEIHDLLLRCWVHARYGLVKEIEERISRQGTRQEDSAPLPTGELANLATCEVEHVNPLQGIGHRISVNATWPAQRAKRWSAAHHDHLIDRDGEAPVHLLGLRHVGNALRILTHGRAKHIDAATPWLHESGDALDQRGLSATIRSKDCRERSSLQGEVDVRDCRSIPIARGNAGNGDSLATSTLGSQAVFVN
jgi:hypothetical protein